MIVPPAIEARFRTTKPYLEALRQLVDETLAAWCDNKRFEYHSRPKELESVAEKIETGRYAGWEQLDDLVACAVVVPTHDHEQDVLAFLDEVFAREIVRARGSAYKPPDAFRFDTTRWIGRLRPDPNLGRAIEIDDTLFEVQIRSAFEHAWIVTTHDLSYKGDIIDWRRARLVAQIKAAVEQIDMLIDGFEQGADLLSPSPWVEVDQQHALREAFVTKVESGLIPSELRPKDWVRFAQNLHGFIRASGTDSRRRDEHFQRCLTILTDYDQDPPRSCSLLQTAVGVLAEQGILPSERGSYVALVTTESEELFPSLGRVPRRFVL